MRTPRSSSRFLPLPDRVAVVGVALSLAFVCCLIGACSRPQVALPDLQPDPPASTPTSVPPAPTARPVPPTSEPTPIALAAAPAAPAPTATSIPTLEPTPPPTPTVEDQVRSVHTRFLVDLLAFDDGIDTALLSDLVVGAARFRLVQASDVVRSPGYTSSIKAIEQLDDAMYRVSDCGRDLSRPSDSPQLRTTIVIAVGTGWRVADFHTAGEPCQPPADDRDNRRRIPIE